MAYVAGKQLQVQKADGTTEIRKPGDLVPEAKTWRNLDSWIAQKRILVVPDPVASKPTREPLSIGPDEVTPAPTVGEVEAPKRRGRPPGRIPR